MTWTWAELVEEEGEVAVCSEHYTESGFEAELKTVPFGCETVQSVVGALVSEEERVLGNGQERRAVVSHASLWASEGRALKLQACLKMSLQCLVSLVGCRHHLLSRANSAIRGNRLHELESSADLEMGNLWPPVCHHLHFHHLYLCLCSAGGLCGNFVLGPVPLKLKMSTGPLLLPFPLPLCLLVVLGPHLSGPLFQ